MIVGRGWLARYEAGAGAVVSLSSATPGPEAAPKPPDTPRQSSRLQGVSSFGQAYKAQP